ncbi:MAG: diiron oxygenase [Rhodobacteraceae bacterium]|nr:diiron oxygenase [Paracoccaceae bacterium]
MNTAPLAVNSGAWARAAALVRPTVLTPALVADAGLPDPMRAWCPDSLLPLHDTAQWQSLTAPQRLTYNHAYACQLLAEFIWIEQRLILAPLDWLCDRQVIEQEGAGDALRSFTADEHRHIESFSAILAAARNVDLRAAFAADAFAPPFSVRAGAALARFQPVTFAFWTRIVAAFETYAVDIGQRYNADANTDSVFRSVFVAHARDEARHCRFDDLLADTLRAAAASFWQPVNRALASLFRAAYLNVAWGLDGPIEAVIREHPEIAGRRQELLQAARARRRADAGNALPVHAGE